MSGPSHLPHCIHYPQQSTLNTIHSLKGKSGHMWPWITITIIHSPAFKHVIILTICLIIISPVFKENWGQTGVSGCRNLPLCCCTLPFKIGATCTACLLLVLLVVANHILVLPSNICLIGPMAAGLIWREGQTPWTNIIFITVSKCI